MIIITARENDDADELFAIYLENFIPYTTY